MWTASELWCWRRDCSADPAPTGINLALGSVVLVAAAMMAALVPPWAAGLRIGLVAGALMGFAAVTVDVRAVAAVAVIAWLIFDGFLVNRLGELSWHGSADLWRLSALVAAAVVGLTGGIAYRAAGRLRRWRQWSDQLTAQMETAAQPGNGWVVPDRAILRDREELSRG